MGAVKGSGGGGGVSGPASQKKSNCSATMAFSIIGWESTHLLLFSSALVVVRQGGLVTQGCRFVGVRVAWKLKLAQVLLGNNLET